MTTKRDVAVVTGASSAIGAAIAGTLAGLGYALALFGRDAGRLERTGAACGGAWASYPFDLTDARASGAAVERVRSAQGAPRVLVHCAGLFDWAAADAADAADAEAWAGLVDVNLSAAMRLTRSLIPALASHPASAVVFIASGAGHQGFANNAAYVASKHGLVGFGRALFLDLRDKGVKVCVVSPGLVAAGASLTLDGSLHERFLRPQDVADAVRYVLTTSPWACPTEIRLQPQRTPT